MRQDHKQVEAGGYGRNNGLTDSKIKETLSNKSFNDFASRAYSNPDGYAIRINPITGQKEMFIAGTRNKKDWFWNVADTLLYGGDRAITRGKKRLKKTFHLDKHKQVSGTEFFAKLDKDRVQKERMYESIAQKNGVEIVYGHSRGGAYVADLALDKAVHKIGLDSAMVIARNKELRNYYQGGGLNPLGSFDAAIGVTGHDNVRYNTDKFAVHRVWGK